MAEIRNSREGAESEAIRGRVIEEGEQRMRELESRLTEFESIDAENLTLTNRIAQLEGELLKKLIAKEGAKRTLESLTAERDRLLKRFAAMDRGCGGGGGAGGGVIGERCVDNRHNRSIRVTTEKDI